MTQLRKFRDAISNYFDEVERGIGKRGSSFMDLDAVSQDKETNRVLIREFKQDGEPLAKAQRWVLEHFTQYPNCTVWFVRRRTDGLIGFGQFGSGRREEAITVEEYRARLARWWDNTPIFAERRMDLRVEPVEPTNTAGMVTASDIRW